MAIKIEFGEKNKNFVLKFAVIPQFNPNYGNALKYDYSHNSKLFTTEEKIKLLS